MISLRSYILQILSLRSLALHCCDKTVTIMPSSFCGMHRDAQGDEMFPDPFLSCPSQLLIRSIENQLVHVQHYRPPDPTCDDYFTVHCIILAFKHELKVQLRVRLHIVLSQIILAHDIRKIIVMKAYPSIVINQWTWCRELMWIVEVVSLRF